MAHPDLVKDGKLNFKEMDFITIEGVTFRVGQIVDYQSGWHIRLDRKFQPSVWMDIDKDGH